MPKLFGLKHRHGVTVAAMTNRSSPQRPFASLQQSRDLGDGRVFLAPLCRTSTFRAAARAGGLRLPFFVYSSPRNKQDDPLSKVG